MAMNSVESALAQAQDLIQSGRFADAEQICADILAAHPEAHSARQLMAATAHWTGRTELALEHIGRAIALAPENPWYHDNRAVMFQAAKRFVAAEGAAREACRLAPGFAEAHYNLGIALKEQGRLEEAEQAYLQAIALRPDFPQALNNLGNLLRTLGRLDEAERCCRAALRSAPTMFEAANNLGTTLQSQGRFAEAAAAYQQALTLKPDFAEAANNLGTALQAERQLDAAATAYARAIAIRPDFAEAINNLGTANQAQGKIEEAEQWYRRALTLQPRLVEAYERLAETLESQGRLEEAESACRSSLAIAPDRPESLGTLGKGLHAQGRIEEAVEAYGAALSSRGASALVHSNALFCMQYRTDITPADLAAAHCEWDDRHGQPLKSTWKPFANDLDPNRPLRVGFVSADFGCHPVGHFLVRVLEELDGARIQSICYSDRINADVLTERLCRGADEWIDTRGISDAALADRIRSDRIDVLIDLAGHTGQNRLLLFARKPAPVQATWIGYVGTTGLAAIDYLIADRFHVPPGAEQHYREKVVRMPDGYVCFCPPDESLPVGPLPAMANGFVTFACFNNTAKINPSVIDVWSRILHLAPTARLALKYQWLEDAATRHRLREQFTAAGVDPQQLDLLGWSPRSEVLKEYGNVDIALDPFPYSGGLTTCEALWMGVPVITNPGATFASRHSLSHLANVGLGELAVDSLDGYVDLAVRLANDLPRLSELRSGLRERVRRSPLYDAALFAAHWSDAIRGMWREWVQSCKRSFPAIVHAIEPARAALQNGQPAKAKSICESILASAPRSPDALRFLGLAEFCLGDSQAAVARLQAAVEAAPFAETFDNLCFVYLERCEYELAERAARRAVEMAPDSCNALNNLGRALNAQSKHAEAESAYRRAIELSPDFPEAHSNLANVLCSRNQFGEAESEARRAIDIGPPNATFFNNLGHALLKQSRFSEAEAACRRAVELNELFPTAWNNLGCTLVGQAKIGAAETVLRRALELNPNMAQGHNNLGHALLAKGCPSEAAEAFQRAIEISPEFSIAHSNYIQCAHYDEAVAIDELAHRHAEWEARQLARPPMHLPMRSLQPGERLRIGFVSADLGCHPVGYFLTRPLQYFDRSRFEIFGYSDRPVDDDVGARIAQSCDHWLPSLTFSDEELRERIRMDGIDILIDLAGHTKGNRMSLFGRRAAPMQATWIGYVGTTGLSAMDYLIADRRHVPEGAEKHYRERVLLLPDGYVCFDPPANAPLAAEPPSFHNGFITFGCFNNPTKIQAGAMQSWGAIMRQLPTSRLLLAYRGLDDPAVGQRLLDGLAAVGVDPSRVDRIGDRTREQLLAEYGRVDIAFDTFPYSGGITTCEALWMGVPVITCPGETFASRHSFSHLSNAGVHELIANSREEYIALAVGLANDVPRLGQYRRELRPRMAASPLCDGERFSRHLADALVNGWERLRREEIEGSRPPVEGRPL